jgi:hypothetical protein
MGESEYLGGVEYDHSDTSYVVRYVAQEAEALAEQIINRVGNLFAETVEPEEEMGEQDDALPATYISI